MSHHHSDSGQCSPTTGVNFLSDIWTQCRPLGPTVLERNSESLEGHLNDGMHCSRILIRRCRPYTSQSRSELASAYVHGASWFFLLLRRPTMVKSLICCCRVSWFKFYSLMSEFAERSAPEHIRYRFEEYKDCF